MDRIPEPHQLVDAYYARLEEQYERMVANATCGDCACFNEVPENLAKVPCGWCADAYEFVERDQPVRDYCNSFEPRG